MSRLRINPLAVWAAIYVVFLYLPILLIPLFSFNASAFVSFPITGLTTRWYEDMANDGAMHRALWNSIQVGLVAAVGATLLGLIAAHATALTAMRGKGAAAALIGAPLFIPEVVLGIALLILINMAGLPLSLGAIAFGHILIGAPFAYGVLSARFEGFDRSLIEASRDLGEGPFTTFRRVTLPIVAPGVVASLILTFLVSFDDFIIAFFLAGTEPTLPVYIWSQLRFPAKLPSVLALATLVIIASVALIVLAELVRRRGSSASRPIGF